VISEDDKKAITTVTAQARINLESVRAFEIRSDEDKAFAAELLKAAKAKLNDLEARRRKFTVPIDTLKKEVQSLFKPPQSYYEEIERALKFKIGTYELAQRAAAEARMLEASAAVQEGDTAKAAEVVASIVPVVPVQGITIRERWEWRVIDASLVPREFLTVDERKVNAVAPRGEDAPPAIPGIEWTKGTSVAVRSA